MMKNLILKYKPYIIISIMAVLILIYVQFFTKKAGAPKTQQGGQVQPVILPTPTPLSFTLPPYSQPPLNSEGQVDTNFEKVKTATANKTRLESSLPIYIKNFQTSNGIKTTLNVYTIPSDPPYLVHIEIYGIDFEDQNTSKENNPNVAAFIDSFQEIKRQLTAKGVDIHNIYFIFGQRMYIQETADLWIKTFGLL